LRARAESAAADIGGAEVYRCPAGRDVWHLTTRGPAAGELKSQIPLSRGLTHRVGDSFGRSRDDPP
jgi:hypothetical protein